MENTPTPTPTPTPGLWLTPRLTELVRKSAATGKILMHLLVVLSVIGLVLTIVEFFNHISQFENGRSFYLFEGDNLRRVFDFAMSITMLGLLLKAIIAGKRAFRALGLLHPEDEVLLEGYEQLGEMFLWLARAGGIYIAYVLFNYLSRMF